MISEATTTLPTVLQPGFEPEIVGLCVAALVHPQQVNYYLMLLTLKY